MALNDINIGFEPNDGTGDKLRNAFDTVNINFDKVENEKEDKNKKGAPNGYPSLGSDGLIPINFLPEIESGGGDGNALALNTFGEIENNNLAYSISLLDKDGKIISTTEEFSGGGGGGGGAGGGIVFRLKSNTPTTAVTPENTPFVLDYTWSSLDGEEATGNGTATISANGVVLSNTQVAQGNNTFSIPVNKLISGFNNISLKVSDSYGNARTINFTVQVVALRISSTYVQTTINTGIIYFKYTPTGNIDKTVHFVLDGVELPTVVTTVSNRELTYEIPTQSHGAHSLKVYMTALVGGTPITSNEIYTDIIAVVPGNNAPIISTSFANKTVEEYVTSPISYVVYTPSTNNSPVTLLVNGVVLNNLSVNRSLQTWNYKATAVGTVNLQIKSGSTTRNITLTVTPSSIDVEAETNNLALYLTAQNRSNSEVNRNTWVYGSVNCILSGFNFSSNGWVLDDSGSPVLRVDNGASVVIPYKPFNKDIKSVGKTIEIEFSSRNVSDVNATIISCVNELIGFKFTPQTAVFTSEQSGLSTKYKENERIRLTILIDKTNDGRLLELYINGIISALEQYPINDNFLQTTPSNITIGNVDAGIDIYNIRVYDTNLNQYQLLDNFIADLDSIDRKLDIYTRNKIYDDFGNLDYTLANNFIPCLTIIGSLPTFKGEKLSRTFEYRDLQNPLKSFTSTGVIDVQGTSSQFYPRKNWKIKFTNIKDINNVITQKYQLRENSVPESTFTFKADFAESSGTHNTGVAKFIEYSLKELGYFTPPQLVDPRIRTTVDGFPVLVFHKETESSPRVFSGKYNFNNDKTDATFGFTGDGSTIQSWETKNNTSSRILFKSADFTGTDWLNDFEARFPDKYKDPTKLSALVSWVTSTNGDPVKFKAEVANYFNINFLVHYYVMTEFFGMVDQRGKNMFLTVFPEAGGDRWYPIFYDNDTVLGINNEGALVFPFDIEYHDFINSGYVWNAESSTLWSNVELTFDSEIQALYTRMRSEGIITYEKLIDYLDVQQSDRWSESIYNEDSVFKYLKPLLETGNGSYLYAAQGSREEHRKWWLYNRVSYMDGKYRAASSQTDYITMRIYTPIGDEASILPNADFLLTPSFGGYTQVKYGSYIIRARLRANIPTVVIAPPITFNDTETIIYGASLLKDLGQLAPKYLGTLDVSKGINLTKLKLGSTDFQGSGYVNKNLTHLTLGNNTLLEYIDLVGCIKLNETIDMSNCVSIKKIYATNSGILGVTLPIGGSIESLHLPRVSSIVIKSQSLLSNDGLFLEGYSNVRTLVIENTPFLDPYPLLIACTRVNRVRLVNINGTSPNSDAFYKTTLVKGVDDNGNTVPDAYISGTWHFDKMYSDDYTFYKSFYPDFNITAGELTDVVTFESTVIENKLLARFQTVPDGVLSLSEIRAITSLDGVFSASEDLKPLNFYEFRLFTGVTSIGENSIPIVTRVSFPVTLSRIEDNAKISVGEFTNYSQITYIGSNSFKSFYITDKLAVELFFPSLEYLGSFSLSYIPMVLSIDFTGSTFTVLEERSINTTYLDYLKLPDTLLTLGSRCLNGGDRATATLDLVIPNSVITIGDYAFSNLLTPLKSITIGNSVQTIGVGAFSITPEREHILEITIPQSVVTIGANNFQIHTAESGRYNSIKTVIMESPYPPQIDNTTFTYDIEALIAVGFSIYVKDNAVNSYKTASNWSYFADIIKPISEKP